MGENPDVTDGLQAALEELTARVSDLNLSSDGLARSVFVDNLAGLDNEDLFVRTASLATGYGNLASRLVFEVAKSTGRSTDEILGSLGTWLNRIEAES